MKMILGKVVFSKWRCNVMKRVALFFLSSTTRRKNAIIMLKILLKDFYAVSLRIIFKITLKSSLKFTCYNPPKGVKRINIFGFLASTRKPKILWEDASNRKYSPSKVSLQLLFTSFSCIYQRNRDRECQR